MRTTYKLNALYDDEVGADLFARLVDIYPEGRRPLRRGVEFTFRLDQDDPRLRAVLALLEAHGFRPDLRIGPPPPPERRLLIEIQRTYDASDLERCAFVAISDYRFGFGAEPRPAPSPEGSGPRTGPLVLTNLAPIRCDDTGEELPYEGQEEDEAEDRDFGASDPTDWGAVDVATIPLGAAVGGNWLVWDRVRRGIEAAGFAGVVLTPTILEGEAARKAPEPLWELGTDLRMPPLSPRMVRVHNESGAVIADPLADGIPVEYTEGVSVRHGLTFPEALYPSPPRFARADLEALGPFDLAAWGAARRLPPGFFPRPAVASARFYRFCVETGMPFTWLPVRIDE